MSGVWAHDSPEPQLEESNEWKSFPLVRISHPVMVFSTLKPHPACSECGGIPVVRYALCLRYLLDLIRQPLNHEARARSATRSTASCALYNPYFGAVRIPPIPFPQPVDSQ